MTGFLRSRPITLKAPVLVVVLMVVISGVISERVLNRLAETQRRHIEGLVAAYLDGLSSSLVPHVLNDDIWEVFDALERSRSLYVALNPIETIVAGKAGRVLAASDPNAVPALSPVPGVYGERVDRSGLALDFGSERAYTIRPLRYQGLEIGTIYATFDIAHLMAERRDVLATLIVTNVLLTILLAGVGYAAVSRMVRPMRILSEHLSRGQADMPDPIPDAEVQRQNGEMAELFERYNRLVKIQTERELLAMKLAEEERLASLGRLASGMAHEINNPLGGLFNALDTLKRHGDVEPVRGTAISLLERGLVGIRDVVAAALSTYRPDRSARTLRSADLEDLKILIQPEIRRRRLSLDWENDLPDETAIIAAPIRQAALNLLLNACAATPEGGRLRLRASTAEDNAVKIEVADSGSGLTPAMQAFLESDGDLSPIRAGEGLGLWMVRRLVREVDGTLHVGASDLGGALVVLRFERSAQEGLTDVA